MFEKQHHIVGLQIRTNADNTLIFEQDLKDFSRVMTISAICQEIGVQALFAAATMGAASYLSTTARLATAGEWVAGLGAEGSATRVAVGVVARVGGFSSGATEARALTGVLSRATAGILVLSVRRLTGDAGTQPAMNTSGLAESIFLTLLLAWAGSPGAPRANITPLKLLVDKLPSSLSTQGGAQIGSAIFAGVNAWTKQPENRPLLDYINANRQSFNQKLEDLAGKPAQGIIDWANTAQHDIAKSVDEAARKIDYSQRMPFFARHFDWVGNAEALRDMSANAAVYQAKTDFWIQIGHCLSDLEQAVKAARQMK